MQPALKTLWEPQDGPQTALLECPVFEVFFGGARGGGKTESSLGDWLQHQHLYGENAVGKFFRRKRSQLSDVVARSKTLYSKLGAKFNENKFEWTFPNGARLGFGYLERDSDAENYQGHNYTRIYIEEATNFPSANPINKLRATLRSAVGVPVGLRLTGNPGGPGHNWVKARYIDPCKTGYQIITESEELEFDGKKNTVSISRVFIPSRLENNRLLMENDPTYRIKLKQAGSAALVKAWLEGDWDMVDGSYFSEWDPEKHVLSHKRWDSVIPSTALRFRAFDWGSAKPFSCGWYALSDGQWGLPQGALVKYREWYGAAGENVGLKMIATDVAKGIKTREFGEVIRYGRADPSIFIRNGGPSIAENMALAGCTWWRGDNDRKSGWEQVRQRLHGDGIRPQLYFFDTCVDTIRTLPALQHDEDDEEDLDSDMEDHAADELRYACKSRPYAASASADPVAAPVLQSGISFADVLAQIKKQKEEKHG